MFVVACYSYSFQSSILNFTKNKIKNGEEEVFGTLALDEMRVEKMWSHDFFVIVVSTCGSNLSECNSIATWHARILIQFACQYVYKALTPCP